MPNFVNPMKSIKNRDAFIVNTKSQLKFLFIAAFVFAKNSADMFGFKMEMVKMLNAKTNSTVTTDTNTFMSKPYLVKFLE